MTSYPMNTQPRLRDPEDGVDVHLAHPIGDSFMHEGVSLELMLPEQGGGDDEVRHMRDRVPCANKR